MSSVEGTRLGHAILFASLFTAGKSIGGGDVNLGWIMATIFWFAVAVLILLWLDNHHLITHLKDEYLFVGLGVAGGFMGIGLARVGSLCFILDPIIIGGQAGES
jgi:hypothetical protein